MAESSLGRNRSEGLDGGWLDENMLRGTLEDTWGAVLETGCCEVAGVSGGAVIRDGPLSISGETERLSERSEADMLPLPEDSGLLESTST